MKTPFTIGVFGIIFNGRRQVLLCHRRDYDLWNLPGGGLESGETPWDGLKREVREETGLEVDISKLIGIYSKTDKNEISFLFGCKIMGGKITLNEEADKIEYFDISQLPDNLIPKHIERIKDALVNHDKVVFKVQAGKTALELIKEMKLNKK